MIVEQVASSSQHCIIPSIIGNLPSAFCNPADEATLVCTTMSTPSCADITMAISTLRPEVPHGSSTGSSGTIT
jgi:hypothetical protein